MLKPSNCRQSQQCREERRVPRERGFHERAQSLYPKRSAWTKRHLHESEIANRCANMEIVGVSFGVHRLLERRRGDMAIGLKVRCRTRAGPQLMRCQGLPTSHWYPTQY